MNNKETMQEKIIRYVLDTGSYLVPNYYRHSAIYLVVMDKRFQYKHVGRNLLVTLAP